MPDRGRWTTPTDLAEHVFCPRALYFRRHGDPPAGPAASAGEAFHRRELSAVRWRDDHRSAPWLAVVAGLALLAVAALLLLP